MKLSYIYILTNKANSTLYIGVTANLIKRIWEHKNKIVSGFTSRYNVNKLVYFEEFEDISLAIARERRLKEWPRQWKINLINQKNPSWIDLYQFSLQNKQIDNNGKKSHTKLSVIARYKWH